MPPSRRSELRRRAAQRRKPIPGAHREHRSGSSNDTQVCDLVFSDRLRVKLMGSWQRVDMVGIGVIARALRNGYRLRKRGRRLAGSAA